jgi:pimeloyl-ACP methyl ester carboxylesterase
VVTQTDLELSDGRTLHVYDALADGADARLTVFWHHGTPNLGAPPEPLFPAAARHGIRWVSYDRPGYGGSTPHPGRDVASAAADVASVADALGVGRFGVMGHSGGSCHALACGALLPERVLGVVCVAGLAPFHAQGLDWFAGMVASGEARLRAAAAGRAAVQAHLASTEWDPGEFTPADHAAVEGAWSWLGTVAGNALEGGPDGQVDDELAYVAPWGSILARCARRCCCCTVVRIGSRPAPTPGGSQAGSARQSCGCAPMTGTSRSSTPPKRPWAGSRSTPARADPGETVKPGLRPGGGRRAAQATSDRFGSLDRLADPGVLATLCRPTAPPPGRGIACPARIVERPRTAEAGLAGRAPVDCRRGASPRRGGRL